MLRGRRWRVETRLRRMDRLATTVGPFVSFFEGSFARWNADPTVANFAVGNPQEMPLPGYVDALRRRLEPRGQGLVRLQDERAERAGARSRAALTRADRPRLGPGRRGDDERRLRRARGDAPGDRRAGRRGRLRLAAVVLLRAPHHRGRRRARSGSRLEPPAFDLDAAAIEAAITPRTRAVLDQHAAQPDRPDLPDRGAAGARRHARPAVGRTRPADPARQRRAVQPDRVRRHATFHSPAEVYPNTIVTYSYGKTLLAPGMRIGYVTVPPTMPDREALRQAIFVAQLATGYAFPNALLQHAIEDLERLSIDVGALERRRDRLVPALRGDGLRGDDARRARSTSWPARRSPTTSRSPSSSPSTARSSCRARSSRSRAGSGSA